MPPVVTSTYRISYFYSGDINLGDSVIGLANATAAGDVDTISLAPGNNTIVTPAAMGYAPVGFIFVPPLDNVATLNLKFIAGDTGFPLHKTAPGMITLEPATTSIIINLSGAVTVKGFRFIWL